MLLRQLSYQLEMQLLGEPVSINGFSIFFVT